MLRTTATSNKVYSIDDDLELRDNFWSYVKYYLEKTTKVPPTFDKTTKKFRIPSWIPSFPPPEKTFDLFPPNYAEISKIIKRMKTSGPPCP